MGADDILYPLMHASVYGRGSALRPLVSSPVYDCTDYEKVPFVDVAATMDEEGGLTIFAVNKSLDEDTLMECDLRAFGDLRVEEHILLHHDDVKAANTEAAPHTVVPAKGSGASVENGRIDIKLPALSWNVIRLKNN